MFNDRGNDVVRAVHNVTVGERPGETADCLGNGGVAALEKGVGSGCRCGPIDLIAGLVGEVSIVLRAGDQLGEPVELVEVTSTESVGPESVGCGGDRDFNGTIDKQLVGPAHARGDYRQCQTGEGASVTRGWEEAEVVAEAERRGAKVADHQ